MNATTATAAAPAGHGTPGYRALVLAMLLLVYTFNFLDRQILGILVQPIKAELQLTDTQLGALGGHRLRLALFDARRAARAAGGPHQPHLGRSRSRSTVWSGFTALCGLATGFWTSCSSRARRRRG